MIGEPMEIDLEDDSRRTLILQYIKDNYLPETVGLVAYTIIERPDVSTMELADIAMTNEAIIDVLTRTIEGIDTHVSDMFIEYCNTPCWRYSI